VTLYQPESDLSCPQCGCTMFTLVDGVIPEGRLLACVSVDAATGRVSMWSGMLRCYDCGHERHPYVDPPAERHLRLVR
jgi:hypothetical protein